MRSIFLSAAVAIILTGSAALAETQAPARPNAAASSDAASAAALISAYRASYGLGPVSVDPRLNQAAQRQAGVVAATGQLSHGDFAGRMAQYGIRGQSAENLGAGTQTVAETVAMWIRSPAHQANLLLPGIQRVGLGRAGWSFGSAWALVLSR
ncbi:MAG TPA: CAP domain-containing protein [Microvirga sp.]|nr:CAP domain-containing protein [Microvirga sp.]